LTRQASCFVVEDKGEQWITRLGSRKWERLSHNNADDFIIFVIERSWRTRIQEDT